MSFLEKDLENLLLESSNNLLEERGLESLESNKLNQVYLGNYGTCDMITWEKVLTRINGRIHTWLNITVVELKKDLISIDAILQVIRYMKGVEQYLKKRNVAYNIKSVLIGKNVDLNTDACYIIDYVDLLDVYTYTYKIDGIFFDYQKDFGLVNDGFNKRI
jgi:hypothetical protein